MFTTQAAQVSKIGLATVEQAKPLIIIDYDTKAQHRMSTAQHGRGQRRKNAQHKMSQFGLRYLWIKCRQINENPSQEKKMTKANCWNRLESANRDTKPASK